MDIASILSALSSADALSAIGEKAGTTKKQTQSVLTQGLPMLLQTMQGNASSKSGAASLAKALLSHADSDTSDAGSFLKNVDLGDGAKILGHIFNKDTDTATDAIAKKTGVTASQTSTILAAAAPLLLSLLGKEQANAKKKSSAKDDDDSLLTGLLGSVMGSSDLTDLAGDLIGDLLDGDDKKKKSGSKSGASDAAGLLGGLLSSALKNKKK